MVFDWDWHRREIESLTGEPTPEPERGRWLVVSGDPDLPELLGVVQQVTPMEGPDPSYMLRIWVTEDQDGHDDLAGWLLRGNDVGIRFAREEELAVAVKGANRGEAQ